MDSEVAFLEGERAGPGWASGQNGPKYGDALSTPRPRGAFEHKIGLAREEHPSQLQRADLTNAEA